MKKSIIIAGVVIGLILLGGVAYVLRPSLEASAPIEAIPLVVDELTEASIEEAAAEEESVENYPVPEEESINEVIAADYPAPEEAPAEGAVIFVIVQDESEVRFSIEEILRGVSTTAVGVSNQVADRKSTRLNSSH